MQIKSALAVAILAATLAFSMPSATLAAAANWSKSTPQSAYFEHQPAKGRPLHFSEGKKAHKEGLMQRWMEKRASKQLGKRLADRRWSLGFVGVLVMVVGAMFIVLGIVIPYLGILFLIIGIIIAFVGLLLWLLLRLIGVRVSTADERHRRRHDSGPRGERQ